MRAVRTMRPEIAPEAAPGAAAACVRKRAAVALAAATRCACRPSVAPNCTAQFPPLGISDGRSVDGSSWRPFRPRQHARDHLLEPRLVDFKWTGHGGAERDLDGDDDAALFIRIDNPAQTAERDRPVRFAGTL